VITLADLPGIPPLLERELDEALSACKALLGEWKKHPLKFGIMPADEWESDLIPAEARKNFSLAFVEQWIPLEQRYKRARENIEKHRLDPSVNLDRWSARYVLSHFKEIAFQAKAREHYQKTLKPRNAAKAKVQERAKSIATERWQADATQEIRLGDMADRVYRALAADGFAESLPGTAERIKEWIKPVAPDYARKPGRRRKTP
jgi:hypothetical protein